MFDAKKYAITVRKVSDEAANSFYGSVAEFPEVDAYGDSYAEAYELVVDAIETLKAIADEEGREFPQPLEIASEFSGRVTLRMPKTLHRRVSLVADAEDVSLNQYIVTLLSFHVGAKSAFDAQSTRISIDEDSVAWSSGVDAFKMVEAHISKMPYSQTGVMVSEPFHFYSSKNAFADYDVFDAPVIRAQTQSIVKRSKVHKHG